MKVSDLSKYFFFLSLGLVIFGWGLAAERYKVFPSAVIARAQLALEALRKSRDASDIESDRYATRMSSEPLSAPRARRLAGNAGDNELILVAGGPDHLTELNPDGGCLAWIIDREGTVQHVWRNDLKQQRALCEEAQVSIAPGKSSVQVFPMGMHLYENGELLVTFIARGTFPYALALVKFDPDSQVVWTLPRRNHHWFSVDETGFIHVPYQDVSDAPYRLGESALMLTAEGDKIFNEGIMVVDPNGRVVEEFSLLDALVESGYPALFDKGKSDDVPTKDNCRVRKIQNFDAVHLNDVRLVSPQDVGLHPALAVGDYLVSLRESNAIAIIDRKSHRVKWLSSGTTVAQHSPRFYAGGILAFDNLGGAKELGGSRLALLDFQGKPTRTVFPRPDVPIPETFFSLMEGHIDIHPDGRRALVASTFQGVLWEIDLETAEVLWEYIVPHSAELPRNRRRIHLAKYCPKLDFPLNRKSAGQ